MSSINISYSSELMSNYMQAETVAPDHKFEAIQTNDGHSILFSISTEGALFLTEEITERQTGWIQNNISASISENFSGANSIVAKTFAVGQNNDTGVFSLALIMTIDNMDHLFVASSYTRNDDDSIDVDWKEISFDAPSQDTPSSITSVYVMQTASEPLIVVDTENYEYGSIDRYYIDPQKKVSNCYWNMFNLSVDMDASQPVLICGGRKSGGSVDGIYTLGTIAGKQSIIYQELYDYFSLPNLVAGASSRLNLPSGATPQAIASTPSAQTVSTESVTYTDLYVTTQEGDLYFFAADNQRDNATGVKIMSNNLFKDVNTLYTYTVNDKVVVWALNRVQQVFYTQSPTSNVTNIINWSYPLPLGSNIEQIAPYVNRVNGGNTYFAHTGTNTFKKIFQDPLTTMWQKQDILLSADTNSTSQKFDSYTTQITITDENNDPIINASVQIGAAYRVPVYINNHYNILDTDSIPINTDNQGSIMIVQRIEDTTQGACLTIQSENAEGILNINPMDNAMDKIIQIQSTDDLSNATVTDDKGNNPQPLVSSDTDDDELNSTVASIQALSDAYNNYSPTDYTSKAAKQTTFTTLDKTSMQLSVTSTLGDIGDAINVAAGDLLSWLKDVTDFAIQIVEDTANKVWNFVCKVGDVLYTFVIDTIEKVMGALEAIFDVLKVLVETLVQFMKFLFSWGDIQMTKDVMKNISLVFLQGVLDSTDELKAGMDEFFQNIEDKINTWADPNYEFPETSLTIDSMTSSQDTSDATSASNNFLQYHLVNNVGNASYVDNDDGNSENSTLLNLFNELMDALKQEKDIIEDALNRFYSEILEDNQYKTMSLVDLLKKSVSILAEAMLETAENIMDTFIDMIATIAQECISVLATPIWIPVLSDILDEFFDTSIPFSWLDVLLLVGAVPSTLVYKLLKGNTPFSDNDNYTNGLLNAKTLNDIYIALGTAKPMGTNMFRTSEFATQAGPSAGQEAIFEVSRILGGICSGVSALLVFPVNTPGIDNLKFFQISNAVSSMVGGFMNGLVQMFAQPVPIKNKLVSGFSSLLTAILVLEKAGFGVYVISRKKLGGASEAAQIVDRTITLAINCLTTVTALEHLYEILMDYETNPKLSNLAIGQIGTQFCGLGDSSANLSVMFVPEGLSKNVLLTCDTGLFAIKGVLQLAQGMYAAMTD